MALAFPKHPEQLGMFIRKGATSRNYKYPVFGGGGGNDS